MSTTPTTEEHNLGQGTEHEQYLILHAVNYQKVKPCSTYLWNEKKMCVRQQMKDHDQVLVPHLLIILAE